MSKLSELDQQWIGIISSEAEELFMERNADLLVCFDTPDVVGAVESYFRLEGLPESVLNDFMPATICRAMEECFVTLLRRGALDLFVRVSPLPPMAQNQLDQISGTQKKVADPAVEARALQAAAIEECVTDFKCRLDSRTFKTKYL